MAIDWASDDFARLFKRETDDDLLLSWEALAVWHMFLKKCDKAGIIETKRGVRGLAAVLRIPLHVVEHVLAELIEDGRLRSAPDRGFYAPNYTRANYTARTPGARQADTRIRATLNGSGPYGTGALNGGPYGTGASTTVESNDSGGPHGAGVTSSHVESRGVTPSHVVDPISDQNRTEHAPRARARGTATRFAISAEWQPRDRERELARELNLDADEEAEEFRTFWLGDGRAKQDWDQVFAARLISEAKRRRGANGGSNGGNGHPGDREL